MQADYKSQPAILRTSDRPPSDVAVCYGPTIQAGGMSEIFSIAALRGTEIAMDAYIDDEDKFTPIRDDYEGKASSHQLSGNVFTPHDTACDEDHVAPPCDEE